MEKSSKNSSFWIGTWNVHGWYDGSGKPNFERILKCLQSTPVDIVAFQEACREAQASSPNNDLEGNVAISDALGQLQRTLQFQHLSTWMGGATAFYHGVMMGSKFPVIESIQPAYNLQLNLIQYTGEITLGIVIAHFNHRSERVRIDEYQSLLPLIQKYEHLPLVFVGDFNALTRDDYSRHEWDDITQIRANNEWESPKIELMEMIKKSDHFYDCLYQKHQPNSLLTSIDEAIQFIECHNETENPIIYKYGIKWTHCLGKSNLGTCYFDTRIDYVLANDEMLRLFHVLEYQHLAHDETSDHKLVRVCFHLKS